MNQIKNDAEKDLNPVHSTQSAAAFRIWAVLVLVILIGVTIFIPVRIGTLGYMPKDDTGRHVGKA